MASDSELVLSPDSTLPLIPHSRPTIGKAEARAAQEAVLSGFIGAGERVRAFEDSIGAWTGRRHAHATSSGSAALHLALLALGVQPGDEVMLPAFLCRAVLNVVLAVGGHPVLADIEPGDFTMSLASARQKLSPRTRVIILPHMFGAPAQVGGFLELGVPIIEDAASSFGAKYEGRPVGSFGQISVLSFASTKMMTMGQGGMLLTDEVALSAAVHRLMEYDSSARDEVIGHNFQPTDLQAAIGLVQLQRLESFLAARRAIATRYAAALEGLPGVTLPRVRPGSSHAYYRFVLQVQSDSGNPISKLRAAGIDARSSVAHFLYDYLGIAESEFPNCQAVRRHLISLPIYPSLEDEQITHIAHTTRRVLDSLAAREHGTYESAN